MADRITQALRARGITVHATREPGGTSSPSVFARVVLDRGDEHISATAETLLMFGARQVHIDNLIRPALARGEWVLCDRFTDATHAYQGGGRGVDRTLIDRIAQAVHGDLMPDCTLLLDVPVAWGSSACRRGAVPSTASKSSRRSSSNACATRYLELARAAPGRFRIIDATQCSSTRCATRPSPRSRRPSASNRLPRDDTSATPAWFEARAARHRRRPGRRSPRARILIHEDPGAGGLELARWIAQLRQLPRTEARALRRMPAAAAGSPADQHPDVTRLSPEGESSQILIQAVRDLAADLVAHRAWQRLQGGHRRARRSDESCSPPTRC